MNKHLKFIAMGSIGTMIVMTSFTGFADSVTKAIEVTFNSVNIKVNGKPVTGENILYNGTTYVPLRAVANMFDKEVGWDENTNTASINDKVMDVPIGIIKVGDISYVRFRDIEAKHKCFFKTTVEGNTTRLDLYKSPNDYVQNESKPLIESVPNTSIKNTSTGGYTLGIEYSYYENTIKKVLAEGSKENTQVGTNIREGLEIKEIDGVEYASVYSIATKHSKASFSYYNDKLSLFSSKDRPVLLIDSIPFKTVDRTHYIEVKYYEEKIYPVIKN